MTVLYQLDRRNRHKKVRPRIGFPAAGWGRHLEPYYIVMTGQYFYYRLLKVYHGPDFFAVFYQAIRNISSALFEPAVFGRRTVFFSNFSIKGEILPTFEGLNLYLLQKSR